MTTPTITINTDVPCKKCGHKGALDSGYCLKCAGEIIIDKLKKERRGIMAKIGEKTISFIHETIFNMLCEKQQLINEAYIQAEGDKLTITISATIAPAKRDNETTVKVAMAFVKEKIKDELEITIDEAQQTLFQKP